MEVTLKPVPLSEVLGPRPRAKDYGEVTRLVQQFAESGQAAAEVEFDVPAGSDRWEWARVKTRSLQVASERHGLPVKASQRGPRVFLRRVDREAA